MKKKHYPFWTKKQKILLWLQKKKNKIFKSGTTLSKNVNLFNETKRNFSSKTTIIRKDIGLVNKKNILTGEEVRRKGMRMFGNEFNANNLALGVAIGTIGIGTAVAVDLLSQSKQETVLTDITTQRKNSAETVTHLSNNLRNEIDILFQAEQNNSASLAEDYRLQIENTKSQLARAKQTAEFFQEKLDKLTLQQQVPLTNMPHKVFGSWMQNTFKGSNEK